MYRSFVMRTGKIEVRLDPTNWKIQDDSAELGHQAGGVGLDTALNAAEANGWTFVSMATRATSDTVVCVVSK